MASSSPTHEPELAPRPPFVVVRSLDLSAAQVPRPSSPLVGREVEIAAARALLVDAEERLLTLTGPGGVGKTRLAIGISQEAAAGFDVVAFVPLAAIAAPELVPPSLLRALGGREAWESATDRLPRLIGERRLLLVLDNLEHLLPAAPAIADLLLVCPGLTILATSRAPLHLPAEQEFPVAPLSLVPPDDAGTIAPEEAIGSEAVRLFVQRAHAARADFELATGNASAVAELCRLLDGLPLAIELAAARSSYLSPAAMVSLLGRPGPTRLPLLSGVAPDRPARHQTMRGAIAWSHDLLDEAGRLRFRRLAVFAGGFSLDAAAALCTEDEWETLDGVGSLMAQGLLRDGPEPGTEPRFAMLETIREYGLEQLAASGEEATVRAAHAGWFLAYADRPEFRESGLGAADRLDALERDHANFRAALRWFVEQGDGPRLAHLAAALWNFWREHNHYGEGRRWLETALEHPDVAVTDRLQLLIGAGTIAFYQTNIPRASRWHEEALDLARQIGDRREEAFALSNLGAHAMEAGDPDRAISLHEASLAVARSSVEPEPGIMALLNLGNTNWLTGNAAAAVVQLEQALGLARMHGMAWIEATVLNNLGFARLDLGDQQGAASLLQEGLALGQRRGNHADLVDALEGLARVASAGGQANRAARLFGAAAAEREEFARPQAPTERAASVPAIAAARDALGAAGYAAAWAEGWALSPAAATAEALAVRGPVPGRPTRRGTVGRHMLPHNVTRREAEILALLGEGLSNREIGDRLFISPTTVARHVANLFSKLEVDTRAKAAAYAHRQGLA